MQNDPIGHDLLMAFYAAVHSRQIVEAQQRLTDLEAYAAQRPWLQPWCLYLHGILANERDHDWGQGEHIFRQVLAATDPVTDPLLTARAFLALGVTCYFLGKWDESIEACRGSLPVFTALDRPLDVATALKQVSISCFKGYLRNDLPVTYLDAASTSGHQALDTLSAMARDVHVLRLEASLWNTLGGVYRAQASWDEAISAFQHNLTLCRELDDRHCAGIAAADLADAYQRVGGQHWSDAYAAYQEALDIFRDVDSVFHEAETLVNLASLFQAQGDHNQALEAYRQAVACIESLRAGQSSEDARTSFFATTTSAFAQAVLLCLHAGLDTDAFDLTERARSRAFLDLLELGASDLRRAEEARSLTIAQVQSRLPADALLLCYFTTGATHVARGRASEFDTQRLPPAKILLFAVTRIGLATYDLGLSPNDLLPQRLQAATERHFLQPAIRRTLYDRLIGPVAHLMAGKRRVYLVPHGPLHYVPFQALIAPDGETLLRPGGPELVYGPSASVLFRQPAPKSPRPEPVEEVSTSCLALGYNGEETHRLRFAEDETRAVAALLGGEALAGPAGKREALFRQGPKARYLHISCHGEFDPEAPLESRLYLGAGETLTAHEVLEGLRLTCDLVTLSACESGLSRVRRGDELMGLVRAFMVAGAPAVIATLWRVDERSTRILMERFYRQVAAGAGFARALREAQLFLRTLSQDEAVALLAEGAPAHGTGEPGADRPFADPFYWAPFILIGAG